MQTDCDNEMLQKKSRACRGSSWVILRVWRENAQQPPDAPILSQGTNQARRGSHKRLTRRRGHPSTGQTWPQRPMDTPARHDQLGQPTLAAWFGAQNGYLDMAAMRPNPPCEARQRDGPGTYHL